MKEYNWKKTQKTDTYSARIKEQQNDQIASHDELLPPDIKFSRSLSFFRICAIIITPIMLICGTLFYIYNIYMKNKPQKVVLEPSNKVLPAPIPPPEDNDDLLSGDSLNPTEKNKLKITVFSDPVYGGCTETYKYDVKTHKYILADKKLSNKSLTTKDIQKNKEYRNFINSVENVYRYFTETFPFNSNTEELANIHIYLGMSRYYEGGENDGKGFIQYTSAACPYIDPDGKFYCHFIIGKNKKNDTYHSQMFTHEYAHAITSVFINNTREYLIYKGESGAIGEALADIFACLQALAENPDMPASERWVYADGLRDLKNPGATVNKLDGTNWKMPEYYNEKGAWYTGKDDHGGVHHNMSVLGKMAYLLCDGGKFRGENIQAMGVNKVNKLFWKLITNGKMTVAQTFQNLAFLLKSAAEDAGFSLSEQNNVLAACRAVNLPNTPEAIESQSNNFAAFSNGKHLSAMTSFLINGIDLSNTKIMNASDLSKALNNMEISVVTTQNNASGRKYTAIQMLNNIPVFASSLIAMTEQNGNVSFFSKNFAENANVPAPVPKKLTDRVRQNIRQRFPYAEILQEETVWFAPELVSLKGKETLAWKIQIGLIKDKIPLHCILVDQNNESVIFDFPLNTGVN